MRLRVVGVVAGAGLGVFALVLVDQDLGEPPWAFAILLAALAAILVERSGEARLPGVPLLGAMALAALTQIWFFAATHPATLGRNLALPLLLAAGLSLLAGRQATAGRRPSVPPTMTRPAASPQSWPPWRASTVACSPAVSPRTSRRCSPRWRFSRCCWSLRRFAVAGPPSSWSPCSSRLSSRPPGKRPTPSPDDVLPALATHLSFACGFLVLPLALPERLTASWRGRAAPWLASALSGPCFFVALYDAITRGWGKAWIGALPVALAALTVAALAGVGRRFRAADEDASARRRRLDYLALFAAVALGFVALAIPLQLDRQWITVAWALEALAVWWLFARLPHAGLKLFGAVLFACVGARLLLNPELLSYEARGLPILNWLLYTYGVPAACCLVGAALLRRSGPGDAPGACGLARRPAAGLRPHQPRDRRLLLGRRADRAALRARIWRAT